jgi:hypothetical protein
VVTGEEAGGVEVVACPFFEEAEVYFAEGDAGVADVEEFVEGVFPLVGLEVGLEVEGEVGLIAGEHFVAALSVEGDGVSVFGHFFEEAVLGVGAAVVDGGAVYAVGLFEAFEEFGGVAADVDPFEVGVLDDFFGPGDFAAVVGVGGGVGDDFFFGVGELGEAGEGGAVHASAEADGDWGVEGAEVPVYGVGEEVAYFVGVVGFGFGAEGFATLVAGEDVVGFEGQAGGWDVVFEVVGGFEGVDVAEEVLVFFADFSPEEVVDYGVWVDLAGVVEHGVEGAGFGGEGEVLGGVGVPQGAVSEVVAGGVECLGGGVEVEEGPVSVEMFEALDGVFVQQVEDEFCVAVVVGCSGELSGGGYFGAVEQAAVEEEDFVVVGGEVGGWVLFGAGEQAEVCDGFRLFVRGGEGAELFVQQEEGVYIGSPVCE